MQIDNKDTKNAASPARRPRREGTRRDLTIGLCYVFILLSLLGCCGAGLCRWKAELDATPPLNCYDPVWSEQGEVLAFLQTQPSNMPNTESTKCSLWTADRRADTTQLLVKDLDDSYHLVGWFNGDDTILLQDSSEDRLSLLTVALNDRQLNKYSFNDTTIKIVGCSSSEVYLQRQLHNAKTNADEIELLTWSPQKPELTKITSLPNRPTAEVSIASAAANSDARQIALVLRSVPKKEAVPAKADRPALPAGAAAQDTADSGETVIPDPPAVEGKAQYSVWVLNRFEKTMTWTNFAAADPISVHTAWSADSAWLASTANYEGYADVALYEAGKELRTVRLRTYSQEGELIPQLRSAQPEVSLVSRQRILVYNFTNNANSVLASSANFKLTPTSITLARNSDALAITSPLSASTQLYIGSLSNLAPQHIDLAGKSNPSTVLYDIASALQYAAKAWQ